MKRGELRSTRATTTFERVWLVALGLLAPGWPGRALEAADAPADWARAAYLGGSGEEDAWDTAIHPSGDVIVVGWSLSFELPLEDGTVHQNLGSADAFVARFSPTLETLVSLTILGGSSQDMAVCLDVAEDGTVVVGGVTSSPDFPVTADAYDAEHDGFSRDAFIAWVDTDPAVPREERVRYATIVGDLGEDGCADVVIEPGGAVIAVGYTSSSAFPITPGAFQATYQGGAYDAFILRLLPDSEKDPEEHLLYSTFFGGTDADSHPTEFLLRVWDHDVALDPAGAVVMTGLTNSANFPTTPGAFDTTHNGGRDAYVVKLRLNPELAPADQLLYGTFLGGGAANEGCITVAVNSLGDIFVAGFTWNSGFPTTPGAFDRVLHGADDAFLAVLRPDLALPPAAQLRYSTLFGSAAVDYPNALVLSGDSRVYLAGGTEHGALPVTPDAWRKVPQGNWEGFLAVFDIDADAGTGELVHSTFVGGLDATIDDTPYGLTIGGDGAIFLAATTGACDLPVVAGAFQPECGGFLDAAVWRLSLPIPDACMAVDPSSATGPVPLEVRFDAACSSTPEGSEPLVFDWDFGDGGSASGASAVEHPYQDPGRFLANLTVTNRAGLSSTAVVVVTAACPGGDVVPWTARDIGEPIFPGGSSLEGSTVSLCAGGKGISSAGDELHFVYREVDGDFEVTARLSDLEGGNTSAGAGLMVRTGLGAEDPVVGLFAERQSAASEALLSRCRWRLQDGLSPTSRLLERVPRDGLAVAPLWLEIRRAGGEVSVFASRSAGGSFRDVPDCCDPPLSLPGPVLVGVAAYGKDPGDETRPFAALQARLVEVRIVPDPDGGAGPEFIRADANSDGSVDISDGVFILSYLFLGGPAPTCLDAADADDMAQAASSDGIDITDAVYVLNHLFLGGLPPPAPYPGCGVDPTEDGVDCATYPACQ